MKFTVKQSELQKLIKTVFPAIRPSIVVPICETIKFEIEADTIRLTASNLQTELSIKQDQQFEETGSFCIPASKLNNLIQNLPDQPLAIEVTDKICTIKSSTGKYELPVSKAQDFPVFKVEPDKSITITADIFLSAIKRTVFACSTDEMRIQQTGVFVEIKKDLLLFTSTDAHRVNHVEYPIESDFEASIIIPASSLKLLPDLTGDLLLSFRDNALSIQSENISFKSSLIDAEFPDYRSVIPVNDKLLTIDRQQLLSAVKRVSGFANFATNLLKLDLGENIVLSGQNVEYSEYGEETIKCDYQAEEMAIGLSADYLAESLSSLEAESLFMLFSEPKKGVLIKEDLNDADYIILMPMFLS